MRAVALLFAALVLVASPAIGDFHASDSSTRLDIHLQERLAIADDEERLVVFVLAADVSLAKKAVHGSGMRLGDTFDKVGTVAAEGTPSQIRKASGSPGVDYVELDRPLRLMLDTALKATRSEDVYTGFTESSGSSSGVDGTGISIAVLDTGIDGTHPFFQQGGKSKVVKNMKLVCPFFEDCEGSEGDQFDEAFVDFTHIGNDTDTGSAGGHGTHVAGIAAGVPVVVGGKTIHGAAPGAKLVGLSIGQGLSVYGASAGLNWVLEHHAQPCGPGVSASDCPPIKVINNSYGGYGEWNSDGIRARLQNSLLAAGVSVIWSAGNGDDLNDGGDGSDNRVNPDAQHPAPGIISVANYNDKGVGTRDGSLSSSSSRGENGRPQTYPDISAPGTDILSSCRPQLLICGPTLGDFAEISGTSMSSPLVAGIVAQLRQAGPSLTPAEIEDLIQDTAYKFTAGASYEADPQNADGLTSFDKGAGLIDARAAVARIRGITLPPVAPPANGCKPGGPVISDAKEDATANVPINEPDLDILNGSLSWDQTEQALTFSIKVADLKDENPATSPSISYNFNFVHEKEHLYVEAARTPEGSESYVAGFFLGTPGLNPRLHWVDVTGTFDPVGDRITIVLPNSAMTDMSSPLFDPGDRITSMDIVSRRGVPAYATTAGLASDLTQGSCDFVIGSGSSGPPPPLPPPTPPSPDVQLGTPSLRYEWQGSRSTNVYGESDLGVEVFGCDGFEGPGCEEKHIFVAEPGQLDVNIEGENPSVNDYDLYLYDSKGKEVDRSAGSGGIESVSATATAPGIYTVSVRSWLTVDASYKGVALLSPAQSGTAAAAASPSPSASPPSSEPKKKADSKRQAPPGPAPETAPVPATSDADAIEPIPSPPTLQAAPPPEVPARGVSTTTSLTAAAAALLAGLGAGFALARRR